MTIYNRPDEKVMAESAIAGEVQDFPDILRGWGITFDQTGGFPPMEWFNALGKRTDQAIRYFMQRGLPEWSATEDYPLGSYVQYAGNTYLSKRANLNKPPAASPNDWGRWSVTRDEFDAQSPGRLLAIRVFATPGTFTYTPTAGTTKVRVKVQGGSGGGGGCVATAAGQVSLGATGSSGAYCESFLTAGFSGASIVVGAAGTVASGASGGNGGVSSFGATPTPMSAPGGNGGGNSLSTGNSSIVGSGTAVATGGNILNSAGVVGGCSLAFTSSSGAKGFAAPSMFALGYGSGGDGQINVASQPATVGNAGKPGVVIIEEYF
jgi:hypothetical protein